MTDITDGSGGPRRGSLERPDPELRRKAIHELWIEDGAHVLQPPQEIRKAATELGLTHHARSPRARCTEARATRADQEFVAPGEFTFRPRITQPACTTSSSSTGKWFLPTAVRWQAPGLEILVLDEDGRIKPDDPVFFALIPRPRALPAPSGRAGAYKIHGTRPTRRAALTRKIAGPGQGSGRPDPARERTFNDLSVRRATSVTAHREAGMASGDEAPTRRGTRVRTCPSRCRGSPSLPCVPVSSVLRRWPGRPGGRLLASVRPALRRWRSRRWSRSS